MYRTYDRIELHDGYHLTMIDLPDQGSMVDHLNDETFYLNTLSIPFPYTAESASAFMQHVLAWEEQHSMQKDWAIRNAASDMVGGIGLLYDHGTDSHRSSLGYWLAKPLWNKGIMTNTIKIFVRHIFNTRPLIRLEAHVFKHNPASSRALKKAGFIYEGCLRSAIKKDDKYLDSDLWSLLKSEVH